MGENLMSCLEPGHRLSNIYIHEALEFCPFLPLFLAFPMSFPRALRAVRVSEMSGGHFSPPAGSPTTVFPEKPYSLQHMQFGDFLSQTLPIRWVKPLERNLNLLLSIMRTVAVLLSYFFKYFRCRDSGSDGLGSDNDGVQFCICLFVVVVQLLNLVWLFTTPWTAAR